MRRYIYIENVVGILRELADQSHQERVWVDAGAVPGDMTISFVESVNMFFDDCIIGDLLEDKEIIISKDVTEVLQELSNIIDNIDDDRYEEEIINDPKMQIVREKAARALELIKASHGSESTVDFVKVGTPDTPISIKDVFK